MCKEENIARLETMSDRIQKIFEICEDNKKISIALDDVKLARPAIIMHFINCEEQMNKIFMSADHKILGLFTENEIKGLHTIRNIGAHDYDGLKLDVIEETIRLHLPPLKEKIDNFVKEYYVNLKQKEAIKSLLLEY